MAREKLKTAIRVTLTPSLTSALRTVVILDRLAKSEEFASSAEEGGVGYEQLIQRIVALGLSRAGW